MQRLMRYDEKKCLGYRKIPSSKNNSLKKFENWCTSSKLTSIVFGPGFICGGSYLLYGIGKNISRQTWQWKDFFLACGTALVVHFGVRITYGKFKGISKKSGSNEEMMESIDLPASVGVKEAAKIREAELMAKAFEMYESISSFNREMVQSQREAERYENQQNEAPNESFL